MTSDAGPYPTRRSVIVPAAEVDLEGDLTIPRGAQALVMFVHGSGSSRSSPRNRSVAEGLHAAGLATLLFDLLTAEEEQIDLRTRHLRFDIELLGARTVAATDWLLTQAFVSHERVGYFGASTGAAAALIAAAERPASAGAVVSRGGRPDLAAGVLPQVQTPTLFIVGGDDRSVITMNESALAQMRPELEKKLIIVPGATHLFPEPGALEHVTRLARDWFATHLLG